MSGYEASQRESKGLRSFGQLVRPWSGHIVFIVLLVGGLAITDMVLPWALALLVDDVFPALTSGGGWELLFIILVSLCAIYALRNVLFFASRMLSVKVSENVCFDLRQRLFDHLQQLGMGFYKSNQAGQVSARVMDDTFNIQTFIQDKLPTLLRYVIEFQILLILLYMVNWKLALASTIVLPFHLWTYKKFYLPIRDSHHRAQEHLAEAHGNLIESFLGAQVVKGFSAEKRESESFLQTIRAGRDVQIKTKRFQFVQKVIADLLVGAGTVLLLGYGAWEVYAGRMTTGVFLMFFWYMRMLYPAVLEIISGTGHFSKTSASVDRVLEMLDEPVDEIAYDMRTRTQMLHLVGPIEFKNVCFDYDENTKVLQGVNLFIDAGEHLVITGPSGGGKSTLISLMPRFNDPSTGIIEVGGHNIKDMRLQDVRGMFGVSFQDAFLFNSTVLDNLRYAKPGANWEELVTACKITGAHEFIEQLPLGYNTRIGDRGGELSHGQKQRINLARALVRNPQTLIIDESTASMELSAAKQIISSILEHMSGRTVIIVTHDPAVMQLVPRTVTLDNGTIASDQYSEHTNMKHPTTKSRNIGPKLGAFLLSVLMFTGCSTTTTTSTLEITEPKSTGITIETDTPIDLEALGDAIDLIAMAQPIAPLPPTPKQPSAQEIADIIRETADPSATTAIIELARINQTELEEIMVRLVDQFSIKHGYSESSNILDGVLSPTPEGVIELTSIAKKIDGKTSVIRFGYQTFLTQPPQLWVEGTHIIDGSVSPNGDVLHTEAIVQELIVSLELMRDGLAVIDLDKKIIQLSYIDAANAIQMLDGLGVTTFSDVTTVPDEVDWHALPYVVQIPEPDDKSTGLVGGSSVMGGNFGLTTVPKVAGQLEPTTIASPMTQLLVFFDPIHPEQFSTVNQVVNEFVDRAAKQIFIEGMVLEINEDGLKDIGINWNLDLDREAGTDLLNLRAGKSNAGADGDTLAFTLADLDFERAFSRLNDWIIDVDIRALVRDGKAEILSRPSILTLNNRQATIRVGEDIPIATSTSGITNADMLAFNFQYLPVGIMLNIRPRIAANGEEVSMMIDTIVSSEVLGGELVIRDSDQNVLATAPKISSRRVQTYGRIPNNTPFIIGGLVNREHHTIHDKVPILGDLPLIGGLFRADRTTSEKTEVIIVLTPHVLPSTGKHLSAMPKDDPRFDDFGNELFRDSYRIRDDDVFDLTFLDKNKQLNEYRDIAKQAIARNFTLANDPAYAGFANNQFPGEPILVSRMIYEVIKRLKVADRIELTRLAFFRGESTGGMNVRFLDKALPKSVGEFSMDGFFRDTSGRAFALTFIDGEGIPIVRTLDCPTREDWRELMWELNQPINGINRRTLIIHNENDLLRARRAVALKHFLTINSGDESLKLSQFKVGQYVLVPDLDPAQVHIIDGEVAKYFFQTEHYYAATLQAIEHGIERLNAALQE